MRSTMSRVTRAALAAPLLALSPAVAQADVNLTGMWQSSDYDCPAGVKHTERLQITQNGTQISAVKTLGDNCVPTGHESFHGTVTGNSGKVQYWGGQPGSQPTLSSTQDNLVIVDANTFTVSGAAIVESILRYTRVTTAN
jgi:hypothetical protein